MNGKRSFKIYNNGQIDKRVYDGDEIPKGFIKGSCRKRIPWNKGLTKEDPRVLKNAIKCHNTRKLNDTYKAWNKGLTQNTDERVKTNTEHIKETMMNKYGVSNAFYLKHKAWNKGETKETNTSVLKMSDSLKGKQAWNKNLTKEITPSLNRGPRPNSVKEKISKTHLTKECNTKRFNTMKRNGNLGKISGSKCEQEEYKLLINKYGEDDIICQYFGGARYPFTCDFYVKSEDLFIEVNGNWTHGNKPFDINNPNDIEILNKWEEKAKTSKYYQNAIYTWTDLDVRKAKMAKDNNLNIEFIYPI